ncbi:hypothetical protein [Flavobacterium sp. HNIBRBA15423]|uniref:hypothetical protein n=1 Tax=Flavobacterium sp. HNIBRBA15423 TaxID=3458683 RepID=UPI0040444B76
MDYLFSPTTDKKIIFLILIIIATVCTKKNDFIYGDLFFKLVTISSSSGISKEDVSKIEIMLDSVEKNNISTKNEIIDYFTILKKHNLLENPSLQLKVDNDIKKIFIPKKEYEKISSYTLKDLQQQNKKVEIELEVKELEKGIFFSSEIISIKEVDGETPWKK